MSYLKKVQSKVEQDRLREERRKREKARASNSGRWGPAPRHDLPVIEKNMDGEVINIHRPAVGVGPSDDSAARSKLSGDQREIRRLEKLRRRGYSFADKKIEAIKSKAEQAVTGK